MEWTKFIIVVFGLYCSWYLGNLVRDLFFKGSFRIKEATDVEEYDISDLIGENHVNSVKVTAKEEIFDAPEEPTLPEEIAFDTPPETEGIPLKDFLQQAKINAKEASNNIQFN